MPEDFFLPEGGNPGDVLTKGDRPYEADWATPTGGAGTPSDTVVGPDAFGDPADAGVSSEYSRGDHDHGLPAETPNPVPGDTVVGPDAFGDPADAGVADEYSRADHDHGLPAAPPGGGIAYDVANSGDWLSIDATTDDGLGGVGILLQADSPNGLAIVTTNAIGAVLVNASGGGTITLQTTTSGHSSGEPAGEILLQNDFAEAAFHAIFGNAMEIGFFSQAPVIQQVVPLTVPTVQDVIDALLAYGLVIQHD